MPNDVTQERIRSVLAGVLTPLARTLLRCGVSYSEFADLAKRAFVDAASADYGVRNRPTNIARVAVMTGLSRKEVGRIRRQYRKQRTQPPDSLVTLPARVLEAWQTDPRYRKKLSQAKALPYTGPAPSFSHLVRMVAPDIPPRAMKNELVRAGAIQEISGGRLLPLKRHFIPDSASEKLLVGMELGIRRLIETVSYNSDSEKSGAARFQRFIEGPIVEKSRLPAIRVKIQQMLTDVSVSIDNQISAYRYGGKSTHQRKLASKDTASYGIGIYYFEDSRP